MPAAYCTLCGGNHRIDDTEQCEENKSDSSLSARTTRRTAGGKAAGKTSREKGDVGKEETATTSGEGEPVSLAERRRAIRKDIEDLEMEAEVADLEARLDRLKVDREQRLRGRSPLNKKDGGDTGSSDRSRERTGARPIERRVRSPMGGERLRSSPSRTSEGYSDYGTSRRGSRERRRRRASDSRSGSRSASRRRRSKWSLKKFTVAGKDVKKMNCYELISSTMLWALEIRELSVGDCRALFEHISFISNRARNNDFTDTAHVDYVMAVRRSAEDKGFAAFSRANEGLSVMHYGAQSMRVKNPTYKPVSGGSSKGAAGHKRVCFAWNGDEGCAREDCRFGHFCQKCGSKSHKKGKCKE